MDVRTVDEEAATSRMGTAAADGWDQEEEEDDEEDSFVSSGICFPRPPTPVNRTVQGVFDELLKSGKTNMAPPYQRAPCWSLGQCKIFLDSIICNAHVPDILLYKLPPSAEEGGFRYECLDGQNRLRVIQRFMEGTPLRARRDRSGRLVEEYITWDVRLATGQVEGVVLNLTPAVQDWAKARRRTVRAMSTRERNRFLERHLQFAEMTGRVSLEMRQEQFMRLQSGSPMTYSDRAKNAQNPYCRMVVARAWAAEGGVKARLFSTLVAASKPTHWLTFFARCVLAVSGQGGTHAHALTQEQDLQALLARTSSTCEDVLTDATAVGAAGDTIEAFAALCGDAHRSCAHPVHILSLLAAFAAAPAEVRERFAQREVWDAVVCKKARSAMGLGRLTVVQAEAVRTAMRDHVEAARLASLRCSPDAAVVVTTRAPARVAVNAAVKTQMWNRWVGQERGESPCFACGTTKVTQREHEAGHIKPASAGGGDTVDNLRPVCGTCNKSMGVRQMDEFCRAHFALTSPLLLSAPRAVVGT